MTDCANRRSGVIFILLAGLFWSFGGVLSKFAAWNAFTLAGYRSIVSVVILGLYRRSFKVKANAPTWIGAAGVALTFFAGPILSVLNIIVGLLLLLGSIFGLRSALDAKALGARYWPAALACSIVGIVLGVAMLAGCFSAVSAVFWICGMALVIYGLEQAVVIINLLRN